MAVVNSSKMNFQDVVNDVLQDYYRENVVETMTEVVPQVAKEAAKKLKQTSPKGVSGKYAKGWAVKVEKGRISVGATVYGKSGTYQLAHLLEHGHATRNGTGRTFDDTPAHPHIAEVEKWAVNEAYDRIMHKLEGAP